MMQNGKHGKIRMVNLEFFKGKRVFITGHNGFKGTWLTKVLVDSGAIICGYSLNPLKNSLYKKIDLESKILSIEGDIRDFEKLKKNFCEFSPEIVIHMAAQAIVLKSYEDPRYTYETNVIGTVNILDCIRNSNSVKSFLNVTTDKVYENLDRKIAFKEEDKLNGYDPYSNSKSCSELVTSSYKNAFLNEKNIGVSTARAGNVIGGGDYSDFRILPDCVRAAKNGEDIIVRNPNSVRPYQHVLDAIFAYLLIVQKQYEDVKYSGNYNVGPDLGIVTKTEDVVKYFCKYWGENINYINKSFNNPHESSYLQLDCKKIRDIFGWRQVWNIEKSIEKVVEFEKNGNKEKIMEEQIEEFINGRKLN